MSRFIYDLIIWFNTILFDIFFREIKTRGSFNVPQDGPVIFVVAPHANQFVDALLVMIKIRQLKRRVRLLIAAKSYKLRFIGFMARMVGSIPVDRAQDDMKPQTGKVFIDSNNPTIVKGKDTLFSKCCMEKGLIGLPHPIGNAKIDKVISDTELRVLKPFKKFTNIDGSSFKTAPKVDNHILFQNVYAKLHKNEAIGIFPEGGSHDRPQLLPLKPGVAIMALGAVAENAEKPVKIIPCGLNYFHAHKFRSRAVLEFGTPIVVGEKDALHYKENQREAVSSLLNTISDAMATVTVSCPDYDTLMMIQATRRLYKFPKRPVPLPLVVDMNRRLIKGYTQYKEDERIKTTTQAVMKYNSKLRHLGLRDHQVEHASSNKAKSGALLIARIVQVLVLSVFSLPGTILFAPVFAATKVISRMKAKEALAGSVVKISARDVISTWKLLVALAVAPLLYTLYSVLGTWLSFRYYHIDSPKSMAVVFLSCYSVLVGTTYAAFKMGEIGLDVFRSIPPLVVSLGSSRELEKLKIEREALSTKVTDTCNSLGPTVFPDFKMRVNVTPKSLSTAAVFSDTLSDDENDESEEGTASGAGGLTEKIRRRVVEKHRRLSGE